MVRRALPLGTGKPLLLGLAAHLLRNVARKIRRKGIEHPRGTLDLGARQLMSLATDLLRAMRSHGRRRIGTLGLSIPKICRASERPAARKAARIRACTDSGRIRYKALGTLLGGIASPRRWRTTDIPGGRRVPVLGTCVHSVPRTTLIVRARKEWLATHLVRRRRVHVPVAWDQSMVRRALPLGTGKPLLLGLAAHLLRNVARKIRRKGIEHPRGTLDLGARQLMSLATDLLRAMRSHGRRRI